MEVLKIPGVAWVLPLLMIPLIRHGSQVTLTWGGYLTDQRPPSVQYSMTLFSGYASGSALGESGCASRWGHGHHHPSVSTGGHLEQRWERAKDFETSQANCLPTLASLRKKDRE